MGRGHCRQGQAMIELVAGLFVIVILVAGMLQIVALATARSEISGRVRGEAGRRAMSEGGSLARPEYIREWETGPDQRRYTADDIAHLDSPSALRRDIVLRSLPGATDWPWLGERVNRQMANLVDDPMWATAFGLVRAEEYASVPASTAFRNWIYGKNEIRVGDEVWLTLTGELY